MNDHYPQIIPDPDNLNGQRPRKDPKFALRGAVNRAHGLMFERQINAACALYKEQKQAVIAKTPEPMRILQNLGNGRFLACFEKKAEPDYKGSLKGGKTVVFEAKFTSTEEMRANAVTQTQWDVLESYYEIGAVCFVIAGFGTGNSYRIPWRIWRDMKEYFGHKYFTEADVKGCKLKFSGAHLLFLGELEDIPQKKV